MRPIRKAPTPNPLSLEILDRAMDACETPEGARWWCMVCGESFGKDKPIPEDTECERCKRFLRIVREGQL